MDQPEDTSEPTDAGSPSPVCSDGMVATIDWSDPEDSTVGGAERWVYAMLFDEAYASIEGGSVVLVDSRGDGLDEL